MTCRLALLLGLLVLVPSSARAQAAPGAVVVVLPFDSASPEARLQWLREGLAQLVAELLDAGGLEVVRREERVLAYERLQLPVSATLSRASSIKVGQTLGASDMVVGRLEVVGSDLVVTARIVQLDRGRLLPEVTARGPMAELFGLAARVAGALAAVPNLDARWVPPPSMAAFELYTQGLIAENAAASRDLLERALKSAPGYDAARLALWQVHTAQDQHQRALDSVAPVKPGSPVGREARFAAAMSLTRLRRDDDAFSALRALQDEAPLAAVANAIGVVQLRRGATPQTGRATYYFNLATELDPASADYFFNLGYAYWLDKDANGAAYWLREAVRRDPADGDAHFVLSAALQQMGSTTEAMRERELARRLSSKYAGWEARASGGELVPRGLERLPERLDPPSARVDTMITSSGQRDQAVLAAFYLDAGRRAFERTADLEAAQELRRALYLSPYLAEAHLLLGRIHLRGGRPAEGVQALKIAIWSEETVAALLALAEAQLAMDDVPGAGLTIERILVLAPRSAEAAALKARLAAPR